ncbi:hypothetical protein KIPB_001423 [Kipferlia bialata]|uniref:Homeobox domain-containing protein n=1 Tax=Kipferlia bialata TaxID=797122 RepID=A0A9K3CQ15_9EUKA|nr:hypothetical protein KIPB_001423 [Kipferlia bialata]|eukprot:g1423.t1
MPNYTPVQLYLLSRYFVDNIHRPYPSKEEVERLSKEAGITVKQAEVWFGNRRKRLRRRTMDLADVPCLPKDRDIDKLGRVYVETLNHAQTQSWHAGYLKEKDTRLKAASQAAQPTQPRAEPEQISPFQAPVAYHSPDYVPLHFRPGVTRSNAYPAPSQGVSQYGVPIYSAAEREREREAMQQRQEYEAQRRRFGEMQYREGMDTMQGLGALGEGPGVGGVAMGYAQTQMY